MFNEKIYITVNHLDDFNTTYMFRIGDVLTLEKDHDNCYSLTEVLPTEKLPGRKRGRSLCFTEILCLFSSTLTHAPV